MYLKRLELRGFKTFATPADFVFDEGITAIVGPNGSGKSNVSDAVRWVLGEQSYGLLRGKRTEDMIFAGTRRRPRSGMAEAVLNLDNSSGWLPIEFSEVSLGRRAYRSGENRYLINNSRVHLRDVTDFVGKVGLGRQGLVTIGQGVADAALSLRPEERRLLFEEAAGIRVYQVKRAEALRRLSETQQNLQRLRDILHEISPRLRDLERQAKRTEEHHILSRDMENLLRIWYGYLWQRLQGRIAEADTSLQRRLADAQMGRAHLHEIEALVSSTQSRQGELRRQLSAWHTQSGELHGQADVAGRDLAVASERSSLLRQRRDELQLELGALKERDTALRQSLDVVQGEWERLQAEAQTLGSQRETLETTLAETEQSRVVAEQNVESEREQAFELATALAEARNRLLQAEERQKRVAAETTQAEEELSEAEDRLPALQQQRTRAAQSQEELSTSQLKATALEGRLRQQLASLDSQLEDGREQRAKALRGVQRLQDRREMLLGLRQTMAGFAPGTKAVLEAQNRLPGIVGPVLRLLRIPEKLDLAIEAGLGGYAQALVVESWEHAGAAMADLRKRSAGWATFLPLDSLKAPKPAAAPKGEDILGVAHQLVSYDHRYEEVARLLLGQVVVVSDLKAAQRIRGRLKPGLRIVTLEGEVVRASGIISGGAPRKRSGLLAQEREWQELPAKLEGAQAEDQSAGQALDQLQQKYQELRRQLDAAAEEQGRLRHSLETSSQQLAELEGEVERLQQEVEWRRTLAEQQQRERTALEQRVKDLRQEQQERALQQEEHQSVLAAALAALETSRQAETTARGAFSENDTAVAVAERQLLVQQELLTTQQANCDRLQDETAAKTSRDRELEGESHSLQQRVDELKATTETLSQAIAHLAAQIEPAELELANVQRQVVHLEDELSQARQRISELDLLHSQQLLEKERRHDELQALELRIEQEIGDIEYPTDRARQLRLDIFRRERQVLAPAEALPENLQSDVQDLKRRLRRLGGVNPGAPEEFEQVRQRHHFLTSQMADLDESSASLHQVIKELDEVMQSEFMAVFKVAAKEFSHYFQALFGGGNARLTLTDPDDPSETGVDIVARPPGKRLQSLALLSGGERALTATALLFAVLKARPLPFCVLDEVDAMLDEANVGRFRSLLEEFSQQTQFVVITHNRQTIEAANTIYGITMGDDGVSQVVSLRLEGQDIPR